MIWLMVAMGGAAGSVMRYGAQRVAVNFAGQETVLGTLAVNLTGFFALWFFGNVARGKVFYVDSDAEFPDRWGIGGLHHLFCTQLPNRLSDGKRRSMARFDQFTGKCGYGPGGRVPGSGYGQGSLSLLHPVPNPMGMLN